MSVGKRVRAVVGRCRCCYRAPCAQASLARIAENNAKHVAGGGKTIYGLTKFSDLTTAEFASRYLT